MINKYALIASGALIVTLGSTIAIQYLKINSLKDELKLTEKDLAICEVSQNNLVSQVERQNNLIKEFKLNLEKRDQVLQNVEAKNKILQKELKKEINEINQVRNETCEDSVNWMLKEAIEDNENISTNDSPID